LFKSKKIGRLKTHLSKKIKRGNIMGQPAFRTTSKGKDKDFAKALSTPTFTPAPPLTQPPLPKLKLPPALSSVFSPMPDSTSTVGSGVYCIKPDTLAALYALGFLSIPNLSKKANVIPKNQSVTVLKK
jgi:hypothetical protein